MSDKGIIIRTYAGHQIQQRADGYFNATQMCKANGKLLPDYRRLARTKQFLQTLSSTMGIPMVGLIQETEARDAAGRLAERPTWVHPIVARHLAAWNSPAFEVQVYVWATEITSKGCVDIRPADQRPANGLVDLSALKVLVEEMVRAYTAATQEMIRVAMADAKRAAPQSLGISRPDSCTLGKWLDSQGIALGGRDRVRVGRALTAFCRKHNLPVARDFNGDNIYTHAAMEAYWEMAKQCIAAQRLLCFDVEDSE